MDQDRVARLHRIGAVEQVFGGQPLQQHAGGGFIGDVVGQRDHGRGGNDALLGIGAMGGDDGDAVARLELGHARADRQHVAGRFIAERERQRRRIEAGAEIGVDEVEADGAVADQDLARPRRRQGDLLELQNLGPTGLVHADCFRHGDLLMSMAQR